MKKVVKIKPITFKMIKILAALAEILPDGISLSFVLGLFESIFLSIYRLKAIAALLAKTIAKRTNKNFNKKSFG